MNLSKYLENLTKELDLKQQYLKRFEAYPDALKHQQKFVERAVIIFEKDIQYLLYDKAIPNKCELNAFNYAKENDMTVAKGYAFERNFPVEHWWVYDLKTEKHIEISHIAEPFTNYRIGNIIKKEVFDKAESFKHLVPINLSTDIMEL